MAKTLNLNNLKGDIDKQFEKLSPSTAKRIDNGGTRAKPKKNTKKKR